MPEKDAEGAIALEEAARVFNEMRARGEGPDLVDAFAEVEADPIRRRIAERAAGRSGDDGRSQDSVGDAAGGQQCSDAGEDRGARPYERQKAETLAESDDERDGRGPGL